MLESKILEIISENLPADVSVEQLSREKDLSKFDLNSITYIKIIVALEETFDVEFDDDELDIKSFQTIDDFVGHTLDLINQK